MRYVDDANFLGDVGSGMNLRYRRGLGAGLVLFEEKAGSRTPLNLILDPQDGCSIVSLRMN